MATTTNFGWETPDDTDLVKDGAAAIRTALGGVDTSFVDLKGGTTGQVLAKASNTDLDYTWTNVDPLTILDAKGDLISATAADTPARLAVGTNGQVLTADSTASTGLKWGTPATGFSPNLTLLNTGGTALTGATTVTINVSSYDYYYIWIWAMSAGASATFSMRINTDSTTKYGWLKLGKNGSSFTNDWYNIDQFNRYNLGQLGNSAADTANLALSLLGGKSSVIKTMNHVFVSGGGVTDDDVTVSGNYTGSSDITSFSFLSDTGNFDAGTVYIYGA
jgi:hypothetical protein